MEATEAQEIDTELAGLYGQYAAIGQAQESAASTLYRMAGYRPVREHGRRPYWKRTAAEMLEDIATLISQGNAYQPTWGRTPGEQLAKYNEILTQKATVMLAIEKLDAIYDADPWSRFFLVTSSNGHIHSSMNCSTCRITTTFGWLPQLSGKTEADAVADQGPFLCSVCFPTAPVEHRQDRADVISPARAARDAERTARAAKLAAKALTEDEQFEDTWGRVTTVAGAIKVLRDEREYYYYYGRGPHPSWAVTAEAAKNAREVLATREARHPGWGKTGAEIAEIVTRADKKNRKESGL